MPLRPTAVLPSRNISYERGSKRSRISLRPSGETAEAEILADCEYQNFSGERKRNGRTPATATLKSSKSPLVGLPRETVHTPSAEATGVRQCVHPRIAEFSNSVFPSWFETVNATLSVGLDPDTRTSARPPDLTGKKRSPDELIMFCGRTLLPSFRIEKSAASGASVSVTANA